jgi:hypothetical protein
MAETEYSLNLTNALTFTSGASANFTGVTVTGLSTGITTSPVVTFAANTASNSYLIVNGNPQTAASSPGGSNINLYTWYSPNTITISKFLYAAGASSALPLVILHNGTIIYDMVLSGTQGTVTLSPALSLIANDTLVVFAPMGGSGPGYITTSFYVS